MKDLNKKEQAFYSKWEEQRKNKWKYVLIQGVLYTGIPMGLIWFVITDIIGAEEIDWYRLPIYLGFAGAYGLWSGFSGFKRTDKM